MNDSLGPPGLQHHSLPPLVLLPRELDDRAATQLAGELRKRLLIACADLRTTDQRRDWLLHMTMQIHHLPTLLELIDEFNHSQVESKRDDFEFIEIGFHQLGLFFNRQSNLINSSEQL